MFSTHSWSNITIRSNGKKKQNTLLALTMKRIQCAMKSHVFHTKYRRVKRWGFGKRSIRQRERRTHTAHDTNWCMKVNYLPRSDSEKITRIKCRWNICPLLLTLNIGLHAITNRTKYTDSHTRRHKTKMPEVNDMRWQWHWMELRLVVTICLYVQSAIYTTPRRWHNESKHFSIHYQRECKRKIMFSVR